MWKPMIQKGNFQNQLKKRGQKFSIKIEYNLLLFNGELSPPVKWPVES